MKDQKYRNSNTKIVHIGMGKNGSTYLQKAVFPFLCKHYGLQYNPPEFDTLRRKRLSIPLNDLKDLKNLVRKNDILISSELLVGWNPRDW